jgi:hypothetical protein
MINLGIIERARKLLDASSRRGWKQEVKSNRAIGATGAKRRKGAAQSSPPPIWMETEARVTNSRHELVRMSRLILRVANAHGEVIVSFTYYAHAQIYYDSYKSPVARAQGETFPVFYNALNPRQNSLSPSKFLNRRPLWNTAILGFILLSILLLAVASGQH